MTPPKRKRGRPRREDSRDIKTNPNPSSSDGSTRVKRPKKNLGKKVKTSTAYAVWAKSLPQLSAAVDLVAKLTKAPPTTEAAIDESRRRLGLLEIQLKLNREVRETCHDELKNRKLMVELKKLELESFDDTQLEEMFVEAAWNRGYRQVVQVRQKLRAGLTARSFDPITIEEILDECAPAVRVIEKPIFQRLSDVHERRSLFMEEGAKALREGLEAVQGAQDDVLDDHTIDLGADQGDPDDALEGDLDGSDLIDPDAN